MCRAAWRPASAATSAVSAACTRLPAANTPGADVRSAVSTARAARARVDGQPGQPRQLVVGDPVAGEHHGVARHAPRRARRECADLDAAQPAAGPTRRVTVAPVTQRAPAAQRARRAGTPA